jgi:hypothetical protein
VVLFGSETWSLTVRGEHKLRVFENRVLRRTFGLRRDGGRKLEFEFQRITANDRFWKKSCVLY